MQNESNEHKYDDIIGLPHHVSETRPQMPVANRAAQFAPFAALTGHDAAIRETARLTDEKQELDEMAKAYLDDRLQYLVEKKDEQPIAVFTYFVPDKKKTGGTYVSTSGTIKKMNLIDNSIALTNGLIIPIDNIYQIDGDLFNVEQWSKS